MTASDGLIPDWPAPAGVRAIFSTRAGGCSHPPWDSLNLGDHVGDEPLHVAANRASFQQAIASRPVFLKQVHGVAVELLEPSTPDGAVADACISTQRGLACTIMVADCLPVLLASLDGTVVAAAHAGWRGLAGVDAHGKVGKKGILEAVLTAFQVSNQPAGQSLHAQAAPEIIAWLGPCIGPMAFEVGADVKAAFEAGQPGASPFFKARVRAPAQDTSQATSQNKSPDKYWADLAGLARARLQALGVSQIYGNDGTPAWCTVSNPSRFFSHRRDAGVTGRMAASIWRT